MLKFLLVVALFALVTYATIRVVERRGLQRPRSGSAGRPSTPGRGEGPRPPARPLGPDDDPDFLRDLDRKRRHPEDPEA